MQAADEKLIINELGPYRPQFNDCFVSLNSIYNLLPRQHLRLLLISLFYSDVGRFCNSYIPPWGYGLAHWCQAMPDTNV